MNKKIIAVALAGLMIALAAVPAIALTTDNVEIRGEVFDEGVNAPNQAVDWDGDGVVNANDPNGIPIAMAWDANNYAGFWYDLDEGLSSESLFSSDATLGVVANDLTLADTANLEELFYSSVRQMVEYEAHKNVVDNPLTAAVNDPVQIEQGLNCDLNGDGDNTDADEQRACYGKLGWLAEEYVALDGNSKKLSKLIIEQETGATEKKTLTVGETWDVGGSWTLSAQSIDAKADPRQAWLVLSYNGVKVDDKVVRQGELYSYVEKSISGETDAPLFVTFVDSVFAGATSDMVQLRYTWAISKSITELKSGDKVGVFEVSSALQDRLLLKLDSSVDLSPDSTTVLGGNFKFKVADDDATLRFYPMVERTIVGVNVTPPVTPGTPLPTTPGKPPVNVTVNVTAPPVNVTTVPPTAPAATTAPKGEPGFEAIFAIAGLLAVAFLVLRQRK